MAPDQTFPVLTVLLWLPAAGALAVALAGRSRDVLASWLAVVVAGISLVLALWVASRAEGGIVELYAWMPRLGITFMLGSDALNVILVAWVALATVIALVSTLPGRRSAVLVLGLETGVNGIFLAGDAYLAFAFLGIAMVLIALLSGAPRSVLMAATGGMTLLIGWFVRIHHLVLAQTGFASTALARWQSLVLFPSEERSLFVLGALAIALLLPAFALAIHKAPRAHRLVLLAVAGLIESFLVLRVLVPLCPQGAEASASWVLAFAVLLMALGGLARGWTLVVLGYQGLVLFGLFSFDESAVVGATLMMIASAIGFFGLALAPPRGLVWWFLALLVGLPALLILVPASRGDGLWAVLGTLAFVAMGYRLVRLARADVVDDPIALETIDHGRKVRRARIVSVALAVLSGASMILGGSLWIAHVKPAAASFIGAPIAPPRENDEP